MRIQNVTTALLAFGLITTTVSVAEAKRKPKAEDAKPETAAPIDLSALDEAITANRLVQARTLLEQAQMAGQSGVMLDLLKAEYDQAQGQTDLALAGFGLLTKKPEVAARANQGAGIAAIRSKRIDDALVYLTAATAADTGQWRAWNALGVVYDIKRNWTAAESAYANGLAARPNSGEILANRGYSRLLQRRFTEALPDLQQARKLLPENDKVETNLRLALALSGDYENAIGISAGDADLAKRLNNAGYAAWLRGDIAEAKAYLNRAMELSETYYDRAANNLAAVDAARK